MIRDLRKHALILAAYSLLAIGMSWPLALNLATAIPGVEGDAASFVWALGWAKIALADLQTNPFHSDFIFYPLGGATQLLWAVSLVGFLSIPLQPVLGLLTAHNLLYLAATVLTGYGTFLLAEEVLVEERTAAEGVADRRAGMEPQPLAPFAILLLTQFVVQSRRLMRRSALPAFTAGIVFAFAPLRLGYGLAFLNLFNTEFIPFYLLFLLRATRHKSLLPATLAGLFLGLNAYIDFQIAAFLILLTALFAGYTFAGYVLQTVRKPTAEPFWKPMAALVGVWSLVALVSVVVAAPILWAVVSDFDVEGGNYIRVFKLDYSADRSYDLLSFFVPNARSTLYAGAPLKIASVNSATQPGDESALSPDRQPFLGYLALAFGALGALRRKRAAGFWLFTAAAFGLFSLGPWLHISGQSTGIPLPFLGLHEIPVVNHIRIPMRYGIVVPLALAILVALAIEALQEDINAQKVQVRNSWRAGLPWREMLKIRTSSLALWLLPAGILLEYAVLPYPIQPIPLPRIYDEIARAPGDWTVLEIPTFNWRGAAATEVYQALDQKRILRVYTNRISPALAEYFGYRGTPIVVRSLRVLEGAEAGPLAPQDLEEDRRARDQVLSFFNLRYAIVHRELLKPDAVRDIDTYLREVLDGRVVFDDGQVVAYELPRPSPPDAISIDLRQNIGQMYAGRGWQFQYPPANWEGQFDFVWTRGAQSEIYFVAPDAAERVMTLHAYAETPERAEVSLNGQAIARVELAAEWTDYRITLPAGTTVPGMNRIELNFGRDLTETVGVTTISIHRGDNEAANR